MQYLTFGKNIIDNSLFMLIQDPPQGHIKPLGGLWCTEYSLEYPNYNEWLDFLNNHPSYFIHKYPLKTKALILTLKESSNIFILDSLEKLEYLKNNYTLDNNFSFEKLSHDYDGIYIKIFKLNDKYIQEYDVNSLILFNLDCIDYYDQAIINFDADFFENEESTYTINLTNNRIYNSNSFGRN